MPRRSWLAILLLPLAACTGPVRSANVDESKAGVTAEAVASAVETARLAAQGTFEGIQPPDGRADELRDRLDEPLGQATDTLAEELHAFAEAHA
jgi:hypothetical protein